MSGYSETLRAALDHHRSGNLQAAEELYTEVLHADPNHADTLHFLGILKSQLGEHAEASRLIERAIEIDPDAGSYYSNLGVVYQKADDPDRAITCYRRAIQLMPDCAETFNNLGDALQSQGAWADAESNLRQALHLSPNYAEAHYNLGVTLRNLGDLEAATESLRRAIELKPTYEKAHLNLASLMFEIGSFEDAAACYKRALDLHPRSAELNNEIGLCLHALGQPEEATPFYLRALQLNPDFAEAHNNLGSACQETGKLDAAVESYGRAARIKPALADPHINMGNVLRDLGRLEEAAASYQRARECQPESIPAVCQLLHLKKHMCAWDGVGELSEQVISAVDHGVGGIPPFTFINLPKTTAGQHLRCAQQFVRNHSGIAVYQRRNLGFTFSRPANKKIRLGYVSGDFREHAMSALFAELFELHDRSRFHVTGYSHGPNDGSATRQRLFNSFDRVVDIRDSSFVDAARLIYQDEIDILVDLMAHQRYARNEIFALRPAPIQVNYLAYPGTSGMEFMDYVIVDDFVVPSDQQRNFSEKLVHLPDCYQVNDGLRKISDRPLTRAQCGLPDVGFVFCSFNQTYKITEEIFGVWMRLLTSVEGSVLWLWESNPYAVGNLRRRARLCGVDPSRLIFAPSLSMEDHLARYRVADLVLDTFPYNGHTTTSDALWAGCPTVTLAGDTFPSRVAGSLLSAIGLPELITWSIEDYEQLAVALATEPGRLRSLRYRLAANRASAPLFDCRRFTANLEKAFEEMWASFQRDQSPQS